MSSTEVDPTSSLDFPPPPPLWRLRVVQTTGVYVFSFQKTLSVVGTMEECEALYARVRQHNLWFGWWSIFGVFWTPSALSTNKAALKKLRELAAEGKRAPDWHPDPSGRYIYRYWDGQHWTDHVSTTQTDPATPAIPS